MIPERAQVLIDFWFGPPGDPERENHRYETVRPW